jgi:hypothetical protein
MISDTSQPVSPPAPTRKGEWWIDALGEVWIGVPSDDAQHVGHLRLRVSTIAAISPLKMDNRSNITEPPSFRQRAAIYTTGGSMLITALTEPEIWGLINDAANRIWELGRGWLASRESK